MLAVAGGGDLGGFSREGGDEVFGEAGGARDGAGLPWRSRQKASVHM